MTEHATTFLHDIREAVQETTAPDRARWIPLPPFQDSAEPTLVRVPRERSWPALKYLGPVGKDAQAILSALPNILQMEPIIYHACQDMKRPHAIGIPYNMPVTLDMLRQLAPAVGIIADTQVHDLVQALQNQSPSFPIHLVIVHQYLGTDPLPLTLPVSHQHIIELIPSFPFAWTCPTTASRYSWHVSEDWHWNSSEHGTEVTLQSDSLHTKPIKLSLSIKPTHTCACGLPTYDIIWH